VCPMHLMPFSIARAADKNAWQRVIRLGAEACIACGCCSYICPGGVDVSAKVIRAKDECQVQIADVTEDAVLAEETVCEEETLVMPSETEVTAAEIAAEDPVKEETASEEE